MRVVVFTTWFPDAVTPATAPFNLHHVQAIAAGNDVRVIHVRLGGSGTVESEDFGGVAVTRIPLSPRRPWDFAVVARHLALALGQADMLHTMAFTSAVIAAPVQLIKRTPWVHTEHWSGMADPASVSKMWAAFSWMRYLLKLPTAVTAVSSAQAQQLLQFARKDAVQVVPNVVHGQNVLAARLGTTNGKPRLVCVGGLIQRKRPHLALEALRLLRQDGVDASLTLVGDGPLRAELEAAASAANLGSKLTITGLVAPERVREELRSADVFLLPTSHETFCVSAAEAVAAGLPAVVTDIPAVRDFLTESNSVLISGETASDFASGVGAALAKFAQVSSENIAETISSKFAPEIVGAQFTQVYDRVRGGAG